MHQHAYVATALWWKLYRPDHDRRHGWNEDGTPAQSNAIQKPMRDWEGAYLELGMGEARGGPKSDYLELYCNFLFEFVRTRSLASEGNINIE